MKYIVFFLSFIAPASVIDGFTPSAKLQQFFPTAIQKKLFVDTMLFDSSDIEKGAFILAVGGKVGQNAIRSI